MVSHHPQFPQRHTLRVTMYIVSRLGVHMSQPARTSGQLNHIDFRRPIKVKANGPDGLAISDSRSRTNGVVALPDGIRLPATITLGRRYLNGKDHNGLPRREEP